MHGPDPANPHPMNGFPQVCFIKNTIKGPNIEVGDYTYYDDPEDTAGFERNVLYHFPFVGDKLIIGKFCAIARGVKFIMNGANHQTSGFSTYPFFIFGNGAIIAARSVVTSDVPAYAVVGGNPAKVIRYRFDGDTIARLNAIAWWDWPVEQFSRNLKLIGGGEIMELEKVAP
ncbi:CatB-related O-acetyltransferase [Aeromonas hydrophila]|uniref:CatB-related O-acetyltransferase n=1 Tax=Aeromonas hydrophila TaxID=644 RepID=UPI0005F08CFD|nr:CatB-related O-acetyltransferase [Aeromonas hydrophila]QPR88833.1 CatB-related O-acetyltransferase [Aeromonas hydrophila]UON53941.1 CatB-related O-acetyltransferase [Aeromonas hydrophila]